MFSPEVFQRVHALCIGDIMLDQYLHGVVNRVSPEAPVPIVHERHTLNRLGGVGNVLSNCVSLGARVSLIGVIGDDDAGRVCQSLLEDLPGVKSDLLVVSDRPTTCKKRVMVEGHQLLRIDQEETHPLTNDQVSALQQRLQALLEGIDVVIVSDYKKGVLTQDLVQFVIQECTFRKIPVVVDPKQPDPSFYHGATLMTPNLKEMKLFRGQGLESDDSLNQAATQLMREQGWQYLLVTRSQKGMTLYQQGHPPYHRAAHAREVFDVTGAGDTVAAVMALGLGAGQPLPQVVEMANAAAGLVVAKVGTATLTPLELTSALHHDVMPDLKSYNLQALIDQVQAWRVQGLSIGFTNGCFDLFHVGHLTLLQDAGQQCDRLIVALNSDASVKRLKGPQRPVNHEKDRQTLLNAFSFVDATIIFDEETPLALIQALQPDVLIKGSDYTPESVVGGEVVLARGGRIHLSTLVPGLSTTKLLSKVA
jgi:D-beta-D-heptose 7-phosphate kinase/D-beta-D-heptose 1-phosphate adenosyltransferase